ncbi:histidine kinase [Geodermatophilus sp. SYSU D00815]
MRWLPAGALAATALGVALSVAADGLGATVGWGLVQNVVVALLLVGVGAPLAGRREGRRIGLLLLLGGCAMALALAGGGVVAVAGAAGAAWADAVAWSSSRGLWAFSVVPVTTVLLAVFPDGRAPTPRWRPVVALGWVATVSVAVADWAAAGPVVGLLTGILWAVAALAALAAVVARWRRSTGVARQQLKYLLLAGLVSLLLYAVVDLLPPHAAQVALLAVPVLLVGSVALAVLRYRLYDVDLVIRRAAVFTGVTVLVFAAYLGVAAAFGADPSERAALVAAVVVAAVAEPVRLRLQRAITRLLLGRRDEPLAALAVLRERLRAATDEAELGAAVVDVVPRLLRTRSVALTLLTDGDRKELARTGEPGADAVEFSLVHQSELLGALTVGLRDPGVPFGRADLVLLTELGHQVAAAAHAVRLRAELRAAADRVSRAAAAERERLRRELHDRLGPLLLGTGLAVDALRRGADGDPAAAGLAEVAGQLRDASAEVRRIVDRLQPVALLERGLVEAVRDHLARLAQLPGGPAVELAASDVDPLPVPVQEAAYFLVLEAVTNVLRHAGASRVVVAVERGSRSLGVTVTDDGAGLTEPYVAGIGIGSMRRRVLELGGVFALGPAPGGGTAVAATFPLEEAPWRNPPVPSASSSPTTTPSSGSACGGSSTPFPASRSSARRPTPARPSPQPAS